MSGNLRTQLRAGQGGQHGNGTPEELASAYHRKVLQWHPDKLSETMAQELRDYATRRTARINEAFHVLRRA
jgi:curved DNA-binding protein CbpA